MEQIRKKVELLAHANIKDRTLIIDQIMQLIQEEVNDLTEQLSQVRKDEYLRNEWKTFAEDCKPEVGDIVALYHRPYYGHWTEHDAAKLQHWIDGGFRFYILPKEDK